MLVDRVTLRMEKTSRPEMIQASPEVVPTAGGVQDGSMSAHIHIAMTASAEVVHEPTHLPPLLLNSVVFPIMDLPDGKLIALVEPAWNAILDILERNPQDRFQIPATKWEEIVAASYKAAGFEEVILTPRSGDFGRDVIATKRGFASIRILDQVKAYGPNHTVSANDVRALLGVLSGDRNASKGMVTTTARFAPRIESDPGIAPFVPYRLELVDGDDLLRRLKSLRKYRL